MDFIGLLKENLVGFWRDFAGFLLQGFSITLAGAQRARVAPRRPRGHDGRMFTAVKLLVTSGAY